jgi:hypothetical protein
MINPSGRMHAAAIGLVAALPEAGRLYYAEPAIPMFPTDSGLRLAGPLAGNQHLPLAACKHLGHFVPCTLRSLLMAISATP